MHISSISSSEEGTDGGGEWGVSVGEETSSAVSISCSVDNRAEADFREERLLVGDIPNKGSCSDESLYASVGCAGIVRLRSFDRGMSSLNQYALSC